MKNCKYCGAQNKNKTEACVSCGAQGAWWYQCANCRFKFEGLENCPQCGVKAGASRKTCPQCGAVYFSKACPSCGYTKSREMAVAAPAFPSSPHRNSAPGGLTCSRCGSHNVSVQIVQTGASHSGRGCLWSIGRGMLIFCTLGLWLLIGKSGGRSKIKNESFAVCQNCGNRWKV